jgi:hypothetical protein
VTPEAVRGLLVRLHECREPFSVVFSGRKNGQVNGTYTWASRTITIHDRNFTGDDGDVRESPLLYTAMHELAHHIQWTEHGQKGARCHTKLFHAILDGLADKAEGLGLYHAAMDAELQVLVDEARMISEEIARLQRELGAVLGKLNMACESKGVRFEDVLKRKVRVSTETAQKAARMRALDLPEGTGADIQEAIAGERDEDKRRAMAAAAQAGKSVAQVKLAGSSPSPPSRDTETEKLLREKGRLEKTIATLQRRLNTPGGLSPPCAAERI